MSDELEQQRADEATVRHALYDPDAPGIVDKGPEPPAPVVREPLATLALIGAVLLVALVMGLTASVIVWGAVEVWEKILA